jgi:Sulfotransferase domain
VFPNTFIAGAQKSGTTTLCSVFASHPQAVVSEPKEPVFFSKAANLARPDIYQACFRRKHSGEPKIVIDGSNAYMTDPLAAIRIREILGDQLQFIFSLREPAGRMVSGYWHQVKKGHDRRTLAEALSMESNSLEDALQEEEERLKRSLTQGVIRIEAYADRYDDPLWNFRYVRNSLYAADLQRFRDIFGSARIRVVLFEELVNNPLLTLSKLAEFLKIDPAAFPRGLDLHRNPTKLSRVPNLPETLRRLPGVGLLRAVPGYARISHTLFYRQPGSPPSDFMGRWRRLYECEVARLQRMLNQDLITFWSW